MPPELAIAFGILLLLGAAIALVQLPWTLLLWSGVGLLLLGLLVGVPAGVVYHVRLLRALARRGASRRGWWLAPHRLHGSLAPSELRPALAWFRLGAAGFVAAMLGCALVVVSALRGD